MPKRTWRVGRPHSWRSIFMLSGLTLEDLLQAEAPSVFPLFRDLQQLRWLLCPGEVLFKNTAFAFKSNLIFQSSLVNVESSGAASLWPRLLSSAICWKWSSIEPWRVWKLATMAVENVWPLFVMSQRAAIEKMAAEKFILRSAARGSRWMNKTWMFFISRGFTRVDTGRVGAKVSVVKFSPMKD